MSFRISRRMLCVKGSQRFSYSCRFGPKLIQANAARAELIEARDWYSVRGAELTARFTAEIETVVDRLATAP